MTKLTHQLDPPPIRKSEAVMLMVHHLGIAAAIFETIDDSVNRLELLTEARLRVEGPLDVGVVAFIEALWAEYEKISKEG